MIAFEVKKVERIHNLGPLGTSFEMQDGTVHTTGIAFFHALEIFSQAVDDKANTIGINDIKELII